MVDQRVKYYSSESSSSYTSTSSYTSSSGSESSQEKPPKDDTENNRFYVDDATGATPTHLKTTFGIPSIGTDKTKATGYQTLDGQPLIWRSTTQSTGKSKPVSVRTEVFEVSSTTTTSRSTTKPTRVPVSEVAERGQQPADASDASSSSSVPTSSTPQQDKNTVVNIKPDVIQKNTIQSSDSSKPSEHSRPTENDFTTKTYIIEKPAVQLDDVRSREIKPDNRLKFYEKKFEEIDRRRSLSRSPEEYPVPVQFADAEYRPLSSSSSSSSSSDTEKPPTKSVELPSPAVKGNMVFEVDNNRNMYRAPRHPYESLDDVKYDIPSNNKIPEGFKPLAAGVKTTRPSVTTVEPPKAEPVYSKVNKNVTPMRPYDNPLHFKTDHIPKKKIIEDEGPVVNTKKYEKEKRDNKPKREGKKFFTFGKGKKPRVKRQISGPVGGVVHYSGSSDRDLIKNLGVGLYDEGARTGDDPSAAGCLEDKTGQVEVIPVPPKKPDETTETTIFHTKPKESQLMKVTPTDATGESGIRAIQSGVEPGSKPKAKPKIARKADKVKARRDRADSPDLTDPTIYYDTTHRDGSMFSDESSPQQKTVPPPLLDPHYELESPVGFQDRETQERWQRQLERTPSPPIKQPRKRVLIDEPKKVQRVEPQKRELRRLSKEEISLPVGEPVQQKGRSSPDLMEAYGVRTPVHDGVNPATEFIAQDDRLIRRDSILDLKEDRVRSRKPHKPKSPPNKPPNKSVEQKGRKKRKSDITGKPKKTPDRNDVYLDFMLDDIPGLEGVDNTVINEYIATLVALSPEPAAPQQQPVAMVTSPTKDDNEVFEPGFIDEYIQYMQQQQRKRGVNPSEPNFFDPVIIEKFKKLEKSRRKKSNTPKTSKDVFLERRASLGTFLADPKNRKEGFTYLSMGREEGPWFKGHQQDKNLTKDELLAGYRQGPKKDPRFPDYTRGTLPVHRKHDPEFLREHMERRLSLGPNPTASNKGSSQTLPSKANPNHNKEGKKKTRRVNRSLSSVEPSRSSTASSGSRRRHSTNERDVDDVTFDSHLHKHAPTKHRKSRIEDATYDSHAIPRHQKVPSYSDLRQPIPVTRNDVHQDEPKPQERRKKLVQKRQPLIATTDTTSAEQSRHIQPKTRGRRSESYQDYSEH